MQTYFFVESEPMEALIGTFEAFHADFGKLVYATIVY